MSEDQIQAGGIELELSNTKKNLMEALNQNADLQKQVEELEVKLTKAADVYNQSEDFGLNCEMKLSNASQRIKELEHNLSAKESQCDLYSQEIDANLKRIKELEAVIAGLKEVIIKAHDMLLSLHVCDVDTKYCDSMREQLKQALSTPTGLKLLAKIVVGEKMAIVGHCVAGSADYDSRSGRDMVSHGLLENFKKALSAYRAACEGGGE